MARNLIVELDPHAAIDVQILDDVGDLGLVRSFIPKDGAFASPADALILLVSPADGNPWKGRFEGGYPSPHAVSIVTNGPRTDQLVVVNRGAGFVVSATYPDEALDLDVTPVVGVLVDRDEGVVIVADFTNVTSFGPEAKLWTSEVSWDGVELDGIERGVLTGRGWDAPTGRRVPFTVDLASGKVLSGPTPRP